MRHASKIGLVFSFTLVAAGAANASSCASSLELKQGAVGKIIQCLKEIETENSELRQQVAGLLANSKTPGPKGDKGDPGEKGDPGSTAKFPEGAVVAFERGERSGGACPIGWSLYREAGGRFIIGAGQHSNDGLSTYPSYKDSPNKAVGGEERVTLGINEIPPHNHAPNDTFKYAVGYTGAYTYTRSDGSAGELDLKQSAPLISAGGGKSHNNMPPFISLYYCKKS